MPKHVGILTSGDCPGLNAALRGFGKAAIQRFGVDVLGFLDGFRGADVILIPELQPQLTV